MTNTVAAFEAIVISFSAMFTVPSARNFATLVAAWVQCLGRPTIRRLLSVVDGPTKSSSSYSRFFRCGRWCFDSVWKWLVTGLLVPWLAPAGRVVLACDDTTCDKFAGAGLAAGERGTAGSVRTARPVAGEALVRS